jgi:hypothetical protein
LRVLCRRVVPTVRAQVTGRGPRRRRAAVPGVPSGSGVSDSSLGRGVLCVEWVVYPPVVRVAPTCGTASVKAAVRAHIREGPRPTYGHSLRCISSYTEYTILNPTQRLRWANVPDPRPARPCKMDHSPRSSRSHPPCCPGFTSLQNRPVQIAEEGPSIGTHHNIGAPSFLCAGGHVAQKCNAAVYTPSSIQDALEAACHD